jgi:hypothetical protein
MRLRKLHKTPRPPGPGVAGIFEISHLQRLPSPYPGYSRHSYGTPNLASARSWHGARYNAAFGEATQAALTKILPGEEDRFGK